LILLILFIDYRYNLSLLHPRLNRHNTCLIAAAITITIAMISC